MLDERAVEALLRTQVDSVLPALLTVSPTLPEVLVVGAVCRDALHGGLGRAGPLRATRDLDLGIAVPSLEVYEQLVTGLSRRRHVDSGIQYDIGGSYVDLMPFGDGVESPAGDVSPLARRGDPISVFGFMEVYRAALRLSASDGTVFRCPDVAGFVALKLKAWVDRSAWYEHKDADDLAVAVSWYQDAHAVHERLYDEAGDLLVSAAFDEDEAATRLLVRDVRAQLGPARARELGAQWATVDDSVLDTSLTSPRGPRPRGDVARILREELSLLAPET